MKKVLSIFVTLVVTLSAFAQSSPGEMSYQSVIRNDSGQLVTNKAIAMQVSILQNSSNGTAVYVEKHLPTTNANGLVTIEIGGGTVVSGSPIFLIDWTKGPYFIKTETDLNGGTNYSITGTSQLLSVPYALHANTADKLINSGSNFNQFLQLNYDPVTVNGNWTPLGISATNYLSFEKKYTDSKIEVHFNSSIDGGTFNSNMTNGLRFDVTIDNVFPDFGNQGSIKSTNTTAFISMYSIFENLPPGTHLLRLVARSPNSNAGSSNVLADPGGWGGGFIIKETR